MIRRVRRKYGQKGVHIAYFVQNGLFIKYIDILVSEFGYDKEMVTNEISNLFANIEKQTEFINVADNIKDKAKRIISKINANVPEIFIISSIGGATEICERVKEEVVKEIKDYDCEFYESQQQHRRIYFLIRRQF
ncbi:MAG: hypothetical protein J7K13_06705 [Thermoplasmata archaeon]|nr:hypothetical protein [Thermoplasmata archaeon]